MQTRRAVLAGIALIALVALGGATAAAITGTGGSSDPPPRGTKPKTVVATEITDAPTPSSDSVAAPAFRELVERFAFLRRRERASDELPAALARAVKRQGADATQTRRIGTRYPSWLVRRGTDDVCVVNETGSSACQAEGLFAKLGFIGSTECGPGIPKDMMLVHGVVPDGVSTVTLKSPEGAASVSVHDNSWEAIVPSTSENRPRNVTWEDKGRRIALEVPVSPDVNQGCGG